MNRIIVIGTSCSGKTTLASTLAQQLGVTHIELDALHWLPNWVERDNTEFAELVEKAIQTERWVMDGNYSIVRDITWKRADTIIWLNYSFPLVIYRALSRTIRRTITRERCCGNNVESFRQSFLSRNSILLWVLTTYHKVKTRYSTIFNNPDFAHLNVIILQTPAKTNEFVQSLNKQTEQQYP